MICTTRPSSFSSSVTIRSNSLIRVNSGRSGLQCYCLFSTGKTGPGQIDGFFCRIQSILRYIHPEVQIPVRAGEVSFLVEQKLQLLALAGMIEDVSYRLFPGLIMQKRQIHAQYWINKSEIVPEIVFRCSVINGRIVQGNAHCVVNERIFMVYHAYNHSAIISRLNACRVMQRPSV